MTLVTSMPQRKDHNGFDRLRWTKVLLITAATWSFKSNQKDNGHNIVFLLLTKGGDTSLSTRHWDSQETLPPIFSKIEIGCDGRWRGQARPMRLILSTAQLACA